MHIELLIGIIDTLIGATGTSLQKRRVSKKDRCADACPLRENWLTTGALVTGSTSAEGATMTVTRADNEWLEWLYDSKRESVEGASRCVFFLVDVGDLRQKKN